MFKYLCKTDGLGSLGSVVFESPKCLSFGNHCAAQVALSFELVKKSELFLDLRETFRIAGRGKCIDQAKLTQTRGRLAPPSCPFFGYFERDNDG